MITIESSKVAPESAIPVINIEPLLDRSAGRRATAAQIDGACRESGFFYITGHRVDPCLEQQLMELSRRFFASDLEIKMGIRMALGGRAWRGYFPVGGELTSGQPDQKEGIYFGAELTAEHPMVRAGVPLHGQNLFPSGFPSMRETTLQYMAAMTDLGAALMRGFALGLGLEESYFSTLYTGDPLLLFRIFNYPADAAHGQWGVGEHTDYGLLTILKQDNSGGLEIKTGDRWIAAPPIEGSYICNIGDMLDRLTGGRYRSTPHRVRNRSGRNRLSMAFFFDPNFQAEIHPIFAEAEVPDDRDQRWDKANVHEFHGIYGDYLLEKVSRVFPELRHETIGSDPDNQKAGAI
jgi:isopenicillin N synthase-like dioxygenase